MSYMAVPLVAGITFVCGLLFFYIKKIPFFEPIFRADFPEELKPFFRMNKCKYRASAKPRHKVLPELKKIIKKDDAKDVTVDVIAHKFLYGGYTPTDDWYITLVKILRKGGKINLIGGIPGKDKHEILWELKKEGANIRFLSEPPITHLFIYLRDSTPAFIWFEKEHKDEKAIGIAYTKSPSDADAELAKGYFDNIWQDGKAIVDPLV